MSHLDELDEFEADLELRLKKEYTAVFGLFRYCVVTQDSTYLCNRLDVKVLPQSTYPFFHVTMEDVWVWDKNRPTRMIPKRRGVHVERRDDRGASRRGRGADDHRGSARRAARRNALDRRRVVPLLLAVDVGNTQTVLGLFEGERLAEHWRVATEAERTGDELGALVGRLLELRDLGFEEISGVCLSTTVPVLVRAYTEFAETYAEAPILVVGPGTKTGVPVRYDDPREVGPDRVVNAVAARERYGAPCIVVDFGTSTNFDAVSADGEYVGGVLAPGHRGLDGGALRPGGAAHEGRLRRARARSSRRTRPRRSSRASSSASPARWTASSRACARSSAPRRA